MFAQDAPIPMDGQSLSIVQLVGSARHGVAIERSSDPAVAQRIQASVDSLRDHLAQGNQVYGVSTGFGGSADARTKDYSALQQALIQMQNGAVLLRRDVGKATEPDHLDSVKSHALSREVVKGAMIARCNSLLRGHSAVRLEIIDNLQALINADMIPIVPLRGSISASGDLTPLSYIAGALEGNPDIFVQTGRRHRHKILNSRAALATLGLDPIVLGPKEGLGLLNGTAFSVAAAALVHHDATRLALLSQYLTAMATEAVRGSRDNFDPFIANARPHPGQLESADIIHAALADSQLIMVHDPQTDDGLYQDRYALRTASQWIGPQIEDLELSERQLTIELNSTTDNPLIDAEAGRIHHGGNFQAAAVSSTMERTRLLLQMIGKLLFSQTTEILNSNMTKVLPPNLVLDDPSISYAFKGVDIHMASYMSEIAFLANPVSSHVQSAEMHNQSINSLALISARYTSDSVELLSLMSATHLYVCCQAMDLQALHLELVKEFKQLVRESSSETMVGGRRLDEYLISALLKHWEATKSLDLHERCKKTVSNTVRDFVADWVLQSDNAVAVEQRMPDVKTWAAVMVPKLEATVIALRKRLIASNGDMTAPYLGKGTRKLYEYVRKTLGVPVFKGLAEHPLHSGKTAGIEVSREDQATLGSWIGIVYEDLRAGGLWRLLATLD